jgi:hypothetical protein
VCVPLRNVRVVFSGQPLPSTPEREGVFAQLQDVLVLDTATTVAPQRIGASPDAKDCGNEAEHNQQPSQVAGIPVLGQNQSHPFLHGAPPASSLTVRYYCHPIARL